MALLRREFQTLRCLPNPSTAFNTPHSLRPDVCTTPQPSKILVQNSEEFTSFARVVYSTPEEMDAFLAYADANGIDVLLRDREPLDGSDVDTSGDESSEHSGEEEEDAIDEEDAIEEEDAFEEDEDGTRTPDGLIPATNVLDGYISEDALLEQSPLVEKVYSQPDDYNFSP